MICPQMGKQVSPIEGWQLGIVYHWNQREHLALETLKVVFLAFLILIKNFKQTRIVNIKFL